MNFEILKTFNGTPLEDIYKKLPSVDDTANKANVKIFEECGTFDSSEFRHTCVLCGKRTSIDESISSQGHRLICLDCVYKYFEGDYEAVFSWNIKEKNV